MDHHALAWRSTSLLAMGELWCKGKWMRGSVSGLRGKWSQGIHSGSITVCKGGIFLRLIPTPLFIAFLGF